MVIPSVSAQTTNEPIAAQKTFATAGLSADLAKVLSAYYAAHYPDDSNWATLESLLLRGKIIDAQGEVPFLALRKKADLQKVVFGRQGGDAHIYAYDGNKA